MPAKLPFIQHLVLIVSTFVFLMGCDASLPPVDDPGNGGNIAIEEEANLEENNSYEVEVESVNEDQPASQTEDSDGEYQVEVEIINEEELASDQSGSDESGSDESGADGAEEEGESDQARSLDDGDTVSEEGSILREGQHVIYVGDQAILDAFADGRSDMLIEASGIVERTLSDDLDGSRHQRFIVTLEDGHTILIAHNIDLSSKIPLQKGDWVDFRGEYEWSEQGGVIHWTHHDPQGKHLDGWIFHKGEFYD